ncbi:hypothetical protein HPP92_001583 [Vanilla planifolia]|uniref:VPS28 N-terminal domain-containing protein n=1 Tax=Vanilla planifolia TaxID=51239 RepID=A0A835S7Z9_VANPL|nr:hypothetical protein HPP92_001583 [Vanilla planifolia]
MNLPSNLSCLLIVQGTNLRENPPSFLPRDLQLLNKLSMVPHLAMRKLSTSKLKSWTLNDLNFIILCFNGLRSRISNFFFWGTILASNRLIWPSMEVKLWNDKREREMFDSFADLYAIIKTTEKLEKAYVRDLVSSISMNQVP